MRAKEFITEQSSSMQDDVAAAIPGAYVIPKLQNQDAYHQYRFGVAMAAAKSRKDRETDNTDYKSASPWGENQVVISYSGTTKDYIDDALEEIGLSAKDKKQITSQGSTETTTVSKASPVAKIKKNKYGV